MDEETQNLKTANENKHSDESFRKKLKRSHRIMFRLSELHFLETVLIIQLEIKVESYQNIAGKGI